MKGAEAGRPAPLRVGIACFSTFGGSGVIASEIGLALAARGHRVHVFSDERPSRLPAEDGSNLIFHRVEIRPYPQLKDSPYALGLTSAIVDVCRRERLDVVHAHYAIPHAISAYLARQILAPDGDAPAIVTTLHGTDITLVGNDPSFLPLTRFSILASDAVTTPSAWLARATRQNFAISEDRPIDVIPNFVDPARFHPAPPSAPQARPRALVHVSNFRPLKRVADVVRIFHAAAALRPELPLTLALVGDGPDRAAVEALAAELGVRDRVQLLGERVDLPSLLRASDLFLLPSETESFGLAALEAMACGLPVVASDVGGLPEVVVHGETGFLAPVGDVAAMARHVARLLGDECERARFGAAARARVEAHFRPDPIVTRYETLYRTVRPMPVSGSRTRVTG
ncbi:MAG TPA: N-acetyl-alpha-D-glucosaminyl L-malate synthase BshA [Polyangia bacterium]